MFLFAGELSIAVSIFGTRKSKFGQLRRPPHTLPPGPATSGTKLPQIQICILGARKSKFGPLQCPHTVRLPVPATLEIKVTQRSPEIEIRTTSVPTTNRVAGASNITVGTKVPQICVLGARKSKFGHFRCQRLPLLCTPSISLEVPSGAHYCCCCFWGGSCPVPLDTPEGWETHPRLVAARGPSSQGSLQL